MERKVILLIKADNLRIFRNIRHVSKIHSIWIGAKPWPLTCQYLKNLRFSKFNVARTQTLMQTNRLTDGRTAGSPPPPPPKKYKLWLPTCDFLHFADVSVQTLDDLWSTGQGSSGHMTLPLLESKLQLMKNM